MCEKGARQDDGDLHQVSTFETDANIRTVITELNDSRPLVRIVGDLIAIGAKDHLKCWIELTDIAISKIGLPKQCIPCPAACTEVCLPLVLWTTWTIIPVQQHHKALSMVLVLACSNFHPQTSGVSEDRLLRFLPPGIESMQCSAT